MCIFRFLVSKFWNSKTLHEIFLWKSRWCQTSNLYHVYKTSQLLFLDTISCTSLIIYNMQSGTTHGPHYDLKLFLCMHTSGAMNELGMQHSTHKKNSFSQICCLCHCNMIYRHTLTKITWSTQTPAANRLLRENTTSLSSTGIIPPGCLLKYSAYR